MDDPIIKNVLTILTAIFGAGGLGFGLYQYYKAQQWKKSEFAAGLLQQLSTDPNLALSFIFLDWKTRRIAVPENYKVFTNESSFVHTWELLTEALRSEDENDANSYFPKVLYRDVFDQFFIYLDRINHYLNIGLFKISDVETVRYYINELQNPRFFEPKEHDGKSNPFLEFIDKYGYPSVKDLMVKFALEAKNLK